MVKSDGGVAQSALGDALSEWAAVLGPAFVISDPERLRRASTATFATSARAVAILLPANREDVQRAVHIANRFAIPVYPISTGKNWGYGSGAPVRDAVLLDLSRLNRIVDFDEDLAYVTVEPGVTQQQLHDFLRTRGSRLWMDATGSSPGCSVVANTLERGFGHTPMGDHCGCASGFEVVLPNGACIDTGFSRFRNTRTGALSRWGLGPSLDGLFSQSNFGIVTRMSIWLMPAPEYFQAFFFQTNRSIGPIIEALRPLKQDGTIRSVMHIGNDYKIFSGTRDYPWNETGSKTPLSADLMATLRRKYRIGLWSGSGALYGTRNQVGEARRLIRKALRGRVDRLQFVDDRRLRLLQRLEAPYRLFTRRDDLARTLKLLPPLLALQKGIPSEEFLPSMYWRKRGGAERSLDPDADRCGLLWCSPVAPSTAKDVEAVTRLATDLVLAHGFEPMISVSLITERSTVTTIAITYDREQSGEDDRAIACYHALTKELLDAGYPPYRLSVAAMGYMDSEGGYSNVLQSIKKALDPNGILGPGRYEIRRVQ
jgi:4-cresol dehydrogenase (hydroxylating) flavoprotein subunit